MADLMAMVRVAAAGEVDGGYDLRVGVESGTAEPVLIWTHGHGGYPISDVSVSVPRYVPVVRSVDASSGEADFIRDVAELGRDCVNQGGITVLQHLPEPGE